MATAKTYFNMILTVIKMVILSVKIFFKALANGTLSHYTNVKENGKILNTSHFLKKFVNNQEHMVLTSDQGNIVIIHGLPNEYIPFLSGVETFTEYGLAQAVPTGDYNLISCHNGFHSDFSYGETSFKRDINTISPYPSVCWVMFGHLWTTTCAEIMELFQLSLKMSYSDLVVDSIINPLQDKINEYNATH